MMTDPEFFDNSLKIEVTEAKRKRRFKIFDGKHKEKEVERPQSPSNRNFFGGVGVSPNPNYNPNPKHNLAISKPVQIAKIAPKKLQEVDFYGEDEEQDDIQLLQLPMDAYQTVVSNKFGQTDTFGEFIPSFLIKNNRIIINEASQLYRSVFEIRQHYSGIDSEFEELKASVANIDSSVRLSEAAIEGNSLLLSHLEGFLESAGVESRSLDLRLKDIDRRIANIERIIVHKETEREKVEQEYEQVQQIMKDVAREGDELRVFVQEDGARMEIDEQDDEFAQSHFLPAAFISEYLQNRQQKQQSNERQKEAQKQLKTIQPFHPIFKIHQHEYTCLVRFLCEELPSLSQQAIFFKLVFRRGTTDLDVESLGEKAELEYKANLLFLVKTSTGKRIGGFISNFLIQETSMQDPHAFLLTFQQGCHKFPIKQECKGQAFEVSRHYLITFGNDLMISSNCLQEESYCQWPNSYTPYKQYDNFWFAGDFEFMIEHIEVYEVGPV